VIWHNERLISLKNFHFCRSGRQMKTSAACRYIVRLALLISYCAWMLPAQGAANEPVLALASKENTPR
jgi:hypothetical protein